MKQETCNLSYIENCFAQLAIEEITVTGWRYKKIPQKEFEKLRPDDFDDLIGLEPVRLL